MNKTVWFFLGALSAAVLLPSTTSAAIQTSGTGNANANGSIAVARIPVCNRLAIDSCHDMEGVTPPKLARYVEPEYPTSARRERLEGASMVQLIIDAKGKPHEVAIKHSIADSFSAVHHDAAVEMDKNAVKAVKKFRFVPAMLNGRPVIVQINVEENFHLLPDN